MLKRFPLKIKNMFVSKNVMEFIGDKLPMHSHTEDNIHITIMLKGKMKIHGNGFEKELIEGDIYDFLENEYIHEFTALEDNTVFLNISKKYIPMDEEPTEEELKHMEEQRKLSEIKNQEFRQMQLDMIKRIEEEDRAKGII